MSKSIRIKEVFGFNGAPYSDYNRHTPNRREVYLFVIIVDGYVWAYASCCHLDEKHLPRVEHSGVITEAEIYLLTQWLREN